MHDIAKTPHVLTASSKDGGDNDTTDVKVITNWQKSTRFVPSVYIEPTTITQIQDIVRNTTVYPSPVRPAGNILSPSAICFNPEGTTLSLKQFRTIHGVKQVKVPGSNQVISCIDTDPGVTLRELQLYVHSHYLELSFSAEIGLATIGGTIFAVTKDSCIGEPTVPGMGIGDVASMLWSVDIVEANGDLKTYQVMTDKDGTFDTYFQGLLDSYGTRGIAVRMLIVARPKTPVTTTVHFLPAHNPERLADEITVIRQRSTNLGGNMFCALSYKSGLALVEERFPSNKKWMFAPISMILVPFYVELKKFLIQRCLFYPAWFHLFRLLSGSCLLRFKQSSRSPGNHYDRNVPATTKRIDFTYFSFPSDNFKQVLTNGLNFVKAYEEEFNWAPRAFGIYFVTHSGKRVAGPYGGPAAKGPGGFSFDPVCDAPNEPQWDHFLIEFNKWAKSMNGRPSLNQTRMMEQDKEYGSTCVPNIFDPEPRLHHHGFNNSLMHARPSKQQD